MKFFTGFESFVGVDFWTCLFTLCNLVILYLVMKKLLFKPVKNMIDSRQKEVDDLYDNANRAKAESEALLRDANRRAQLREEEILRDAQDKAAQTMQRAEAQVALEKKRAMNEIKDDVSDMAVDIASAVLQRDIRSEEHTELIDSFIEKLGDSHD